MEKWKKLIATFELHGINAETAARLLMEFMVNELDSLDDETDTCLEWADLNWCEQDASSFYDDLLKTIR